MAGEAHSGDRTGPPRSRRPRLPRPRPRRGAWRVLARSEIDRLRDELAIAGPPPEANHISGGIDEASYVNTVRRTVEEHLTKASDALTPVGPLHALLDWYSGAALEQTWLNIHRAAEALLMIQSPGSLTSEFVQTDTAFRTTIDVSDPRFVNLAPVLAEINTVLLVAQRPDLLTGIQRSKLKAIRNVVNIASDTAHETVRRWRNLLFIGGAVLGCLAAAVTVVHAVAPEFFSLVPVGVAANGVDAIEPWQVVLVGSLGGALAAVLALNRFSGFTDPAGLPVLQALLRIPTAAATSLVGVLLMQTAALDALQPQRGAKVLAYAFFFGYAQEPLLRAIDRRAGAVLNPARSTDEPARSVPPSTPTAGSLAATPPAPASPPAAEPGASPTTADTVIPPAEAPDTSAAHPDDHSSDS